MKPKFLSLLKLDAPQDINIYLGNSNLEHMKTSHPEDFEQFGAELVNILAYPDYIGYRKKDGTFEFVKEFEINGKHVKVAVRASSNGVLYARSLYVLNEEKVKHWIETGTIIPVK